MDVSSSQCATTSVELEVSATEAQLDNSQGEEAIVAEKLKRPKEKNNNLPAPEPEPEPDY